MKVIKNLLNTPTVFMTMATMVVAIVLCVLNPDVNGPILITFLGSFVILFGLLFIRIFFKEKKFNFKEGKVKWINKITKYFNENESYESIIRKVLVVILFFVFVIRFMSGHDYLESVYSIYGSEFMSEFDVIISTFFTCWMIGALLFIVIAEFIKASTFKVISRYLSFPVLFVTFIFFIQVLEGISGNILKNGLDFRCYLMGVELAFGLGFSIYSFVEKSIEVSNNDSLKNIILSKDILKVNKSEVYGLAIAYLFLILTSISAYAPHVLFNENSGYIPLPLEINWTHRIYIYLVFLLPILYFILLYRYDIPHRRAFLIFISLNILFAYLGFRRYDIWTSVGSLPLHLCNTAMYIIPLTLIFKTTKVFYFTMFINVIGAFLALIMPNYSESLGFFSQGTIEFYLNHLYAAFMPVLIVLLGIYDRPKIKYFIYSMVGFLAYYLLVLILNSIYGTDFFFINSNFIADKLGTWAEDIFDISWSFNIGETTLEFHPVYQVLFFLTYVLLAFGMWYVYELLFKVVDGATLLVEKNKIYKKNQLDYYEMVKKERGIDMKKTKEKIQKIDFSELDAKLEIKHLQKRYGNSEKNAVEDFSLSLEGGKIYGFLGKNGAGKSTIIKSIVGMHTFNGGTIEVCGYDVEHQPIEAKSCIGFVPDHYALYENLTGRQYINYIADLYDVSKEDRETRLKDLLPRLEMEDKFDKQMKTYSHGMKQKITIIGALIHNPKIWILDEPMTGVDPNSIFQIKECMREHAKKGNIVFFSSHLIDVVSNLCDEVIMIKHGDFVLRTSLEELKENKIDLEALFLEKTADTEEEGKKIAEEVEQSK